MAEDKLFSRLDNLDDIAEDMQRDLDAAKTIEGGGPA